MEMSPPRARRFGLEHVAAFDDQALRTFLAPGDRGVDPARLGTALQGRDNDALAGRIAAALEEPARAALALGRSSPADPGAVESARRHVVNRLFWALLYWHDPDAYEELVAGERIHPGVLEMLELAGRVVADLGAGAGRFTLFAAERARRVIAVDAVPALLARLEAHAAARGLDNIETRRGGFLDLPLDDSSVDLAVACSALTSHAPWGGEGALREAIRIVRPGGQVAVIWPDDPAWFTARGFDHVSLPGDHGLRFEDAATAERICRDFYSDQAADWVRSHAATTVPFAILGTPPPNDACFLRVGTTSADSPGGDGHPRPGAETG